MNHIEKLQCGLHDNFNNNRFAIDNQYVLVTQYICGNHHTDRIKGCQSGSIFTIANIPEDLNIILNCIDIAIVK